MKISLVVNSSHLDNNLLTSLKKKVTDYGFTLDEIHPDVVIFIGGDGTFLKCIQKYLPIIDSISFLGVNNGSLGFFYDFHLSEFEEALECLKTKQYREYVLPLLQGVARGNKKEESFFSINEIRLENPFKTFICDVLINKEKLEIYRGNGLSVSSSVGSSGFNKSLGGALINPTLPLLEISEIAPLSNNVYRSLGSPLITKGDDTITFKGNFDHVVIGYDSEVNDLSFANELSITLSNKKVHLLYSKKHSYIQTLNRCFVR